MSAPPPPSEPPEPDATVGAASDGTSDSTATPAPLPEGLRLQVIDGVATLWLDRPATRNALTYAMWLGLAEVCDRLAGDPAVRLLVVRGADGHFSAGADIAGFGAASPEDYRAANVAADAALAGFPKPTLAVISGVCVGGGAEIAAACDLRVADDTSRFGVTPARLGILYPAPAVERLVRLVGPAAATHLLFTAEIVDAARALRIGLVHEVVPADAFEERVRELIDLVAHRRSLLTQMASKAIIAAAVAGADVGPVEERWEAELGASSDAAEGVASFLERRPPSFTWTPPPT